MEINSKKDINIKQETINWKQRRYEIAKDIFIALLTFLTEPETKISDSYIGIAVEFVDAFIEDLKK